TRKVSSRSFSASSEQPAPTSTAAAAIAANHPVYRPRCAPPLAFRMNPFSLHRPEQLACRTERRKDRKIRDGFRNRSAEGAGPRTVVPSNASKHGEPPPMTALSRSTLIFVAVVLVGCSRSPEPAKTSAAATPAPNTTAAGAQHGDAIAWRKGDVDAAFVQAKTDHKPLFLYWGAVWCPPCNQVKATLFTRQDFIDRQSHLLPVYIDGDSPGAQKLGERFKIVGYPTMILFSPDGREIVRLPGEADPEQYMNVLTMAMNGARPVKETL